MIVKNQESAFNIEVTLRDLQKRLYACDAISQQEKLKLTKNIQFQLKSADLNSANALIKKVNDLIGVTETVATADFKYPGNISFSKLLDSGNLYEVNNETQKNTTYIYFSEDFIVDFSKCNDKSQDKFCKLFQDGSVNAAAAKNEQGIKYIGAKANLPKCHLKFAEGTYDTTITHELKVMVTKDRIGVIALKPLNDGPEILIATHLLKGGIHNNKHNGKSLITKEFNSDKLPKNTQANLLAKNGIFKATAPCRNEAKAEISSKSQPSIK